MFLRRRFEVFCCSYVSVCMLLRRKVICFCEGGIGTLTPPL